MQANRYKDLKNSLVKRQWKSNIWVSDGVQYPQDPAHRDVCIGIVASDKGLAEIRRLR